MLICDILRVHAKAPKYIYVDALWYLHDFTKARNSECKIKCQSLKFGFAVYRLSSLTVSSFSDPIRYALCTLLFHPTLLPSYLLALTLPASLLLNFLLFPSPIGAPGGWVREDGIGRSIAERSGCCRADPPDGRWTHKAA